MLVCESQGYNVRSFKIWVHASDCGGWKIVVAQMKMWKGLLDYSICVMGIFHGLKIFLGWLKIYFQSLKMRKCGLGRVNVDCHGTRTKVRMCES